MESLFEPLAFQDITSSITDNSDAFLSFSSLSNFENIDSLFESEALFLPPNQLVPIPSPTKSAPESLSSFGSASPSPKDIHASFFDFDLDLVPPGEIGIFHTPSKAGPSKLGKPAQIIDATYGATYDDPVWADQSTPGFTARTSSDSFGSSSSISTNGTRDYYLPPGHAALGRSPYHWDDHALGASTSSSPYVPSTPTPLRVTSNPSLRSDPTLRTVKQVKSMPALQEEPVQVYSFSVQDAPPLVTDALWQSPPSTSGGYSTSAPEGPTQYSQIGYADVQGSIRNDSSLAPGDPASWELTVEDVNRILAQEFPLPELTFSTEYPPAEDEARPSSAPGLQMSALHPEGLLSVPAAGTMTRSLSANGFVPHRVSNAGSLFNFAPQQFPSGQPGSIQPLFTHAPQNYSQSPVQSRAVSSPVSGWEPAKTVNPRTFSSGQPLSHIPLNVQITPAGSTYSDEEVPGASLLAPHPPVQPWDQDPSAAMEMMRVASNPIPRPRSAGPPLMPADASYYPVAEHTPLAPVHLEQPIRSAPHSPHTPMRGSSRSTHPFTTAPISYTPPNNDIFTSTPLGTVVHPPPASYTYGARPVTPTRIIHPPPYTPSPAGSSSRPTARLPSRAQRSPASPTAPKRKGRQAQAASGGGFEMSFINYTSKDAQKLLTGVAPSGSQNKRKREEAAALAPEHGAEDTAEPLGRDKRSRSLSEEAD